MGLADILTIIGSLLTGIGVLYAAHQVRLARRTARAQFFMQLDAMFQHHTEVANRLRTDWRTGGPATVEDWIAVENYMLLFEHVQLLIEDGIFDLHTFDRLYGYRLFYVTENSIIRKHKLEERCDQWVHFITLWRSLEGIGRDRQMYPAHPLKDPAAQEPGGG